VKENVVASKIAENAQPKKKKKQTLFVCQNIQKPCKVQKDKPGQSLLLGI
jgi:hypothetical protein